MFDIADDFFVQGLRRQLAGQGVPFDVLELDVSQPDGAAHEVLDDVQTRGHGLEAVLKGRGSACQLPYPGSDVGSLSGDVGELRLPVGEKGRQLVDLIERQHFAHHAVRRLHTCIIQDAIFRWGWVSGKFRVE